MIKQGSHYRTGNPVLSFLSLMGLLYRGLWGFLCYYLLFVVPKANNIFITKIVKTS
jgi:hypothetical protein